MFRDFKNRVVMKFDPVYDTSQVAKTGEVVHGDFKLILSGHRTIGFEEVLKNGPLLLVFIKGTWCPFCQIHLQRLREWAESIKSKVTTIVVSSEDIETITKWLRDNPSTYLFASDKNGEASKKFRVWLDEKNYSQAATFLVDIDKTIRFSYAGKRDQDRTKMMPGL